MESFYSNTNLKALVRPYKDGLPYYRPFILHGEPEKIELFLIGINPASSFFPEKGINIDNWIESLLNHNLYYERYSSNGQTRVGIRGILSYLKEHYPFSLFETNINAYPTQKAIDLKDTLIRDAVHEGEHRFLKVFTTHEPSIIILHSQHTTKRFINLLERYKLIPQRSVVIKTPIIQREKQFPHFTFRYASGKQANVFACRHLKLFGHKGMTFRDFLEGITPFLNVT